MKAIANIFPVLLLLINTTAVFAKTDQQEFDGIWDVIVNSENDESVSCPEMRNHTFFKVVSYDGFIFNSATKDLVDIDDEGKFNFVTKTGAATVSGQFEANGSGAGTIVWNVEIALSDGPGCRWDFTLQRVSMDKRLVVDTVSRRVLIIRTSTSDCENFQLLDIADMHKPDPRSIVLKPNYGIIKLVTREKQNQCVAELLYQPDEGFTGYDQVVSISPMSDNPFRDIVAVGIEVR